MEIAVDRTKLLEILRDNRTRWEDCVAVVAEPDGRRVLLGLTATPSDSIRAIGVAA